MNSKKCLLAAVIGFASMTAAAQEKWEIGIPGNANYDYLQYYDHLKNYVDRTKYPNFRVGVALDAASYNNSSSVIKKLSVANANEIVTGNDMKMGSIVNGSGTMNFSTVKTFVNNAVAAGHQVYGHTLAWHAQQPGGWLHSLMKDKPAQPIEGANTTAYLDFMEKDFRKSQNVGWTGDQTKFGFSFSYNATDGMKVTTTKKVNNYEVQYVAVSDITVKKGESCKMIMTVKGSSTGSMTAKLGDWTSGPTKTISFTTEWQDIEVEYTNCIGSSFLLLQHGNFVGNIYIKQIRFQEKVMGKAVEEDTRCIVLNKPANGTTAYDKKFLLQAATQTGDQYEFSALVRADNPAVISTSTHVRAGSVSDNVSIGSFQFNQSWRTITASGTIPKGGRFLAFNLDDYEGANKYYFDNISLKINGVEIIVNGGLDSDDMTSFLERNDQNKYVACGVTDHIQYLLLPLPIPQTAEEKHDTLVYAMDKWIKGMMEACGGKVKAWDLVNEAISGGNADSEGVYALQHNNGTSNDFFWQDYMGDLEYVRQACRLARKYGPEDIKLFINDYNLESDWDGNGKLKSLIKWIQRWEADGVTYIDGIGSQMHISCSMNAATLDSRRRHIANMFKLMAESGKMVRVSELDMGMDDANGKAVATADMTEEMHQKMAEHYEYIVKTYLETVPPAQQWGICQWCTTDSPASSGWRANTPVGLWTLDYYRKHTYAGFARGLGANPLAIDSPQQSIVNGQRSKIYNINGQYLGNDLNTLPAGLYIRDGKKVVKK